MFHGGKICNFFTSVNKEVFVIAELICLVLSATVLFESNYIYAEDSSMEYSQYAALLKDETELLRCFSDEEIHDGKTLRFGLADVNGDGFSDLIASMDEADSKKNGNTCFYTIIDTKPCLIGVVKTDPSESVGYDEENGYAYVYKEDTNGEQKIDLLKFAKEPYDFLTGNNNCSALMSFRLLPDEEDGLHYYVNGEDVTEKHFSEEFIRYLGKPIPFYEDAYYFGWDGYELIAEQENTSEGRLQVLGCDGSMPLVQESESETTPETEACTEAESEFDTEKEERTEFETETFTLVKDETEILQPTEKELEHPEEAEDLKKQETEVREPLETESVQLLITDETQQYETEAVLIPETEKIDPLTIEGEIGEGSEGWVCPECGNEAIGNFCGNCGIANPSSAWICPECKEIATGNFCSNCGASKPIGERGIAEDTGELSNDAISTGVMLTDLESYTVNMQSAQTLEDNYGNTYDYAITNDQWVHVGDGAFSYRYLINSEYGMISGIIYVPKGETTGLLSSLQIKGDGHVIYSSPVFTKLSEPVRFDVNIKGINDLEIRYLNNSYYNNTSDLELCIANVELFKAIDADADVDITSFPVSLLDMESIYSDVKETNQLFDNFDNSYNNAIYNRVDHSHSNHPPIYEYIFNSKYRELTGTLYVPKGSSFDGEVNMTVTVDGVTRYISPMFSRSSVPVEFSVDVSGGNDIQITFSEQCWYESESDKTLCIANACLYQ